MQEIEIKFLGINKLELENKIKALAGIHDKEYAKMTFDEVVKK